MSVTFRMIAQQSVGKYFVGVPQWLTPNLRASQLDWGVPAEVLVMKEWNDSMSQSAIAQNVDTDRLANMPEFRQKLKAQFQAANTEIVITNKVWSLQ